MPSGDALLTMLLDLVARLRHAGVSVSMAEKVDATRALMLLPLDERAVLCSALRAVMVKRVEDHATFDRLFDVSFPLTGSAVESTASLASDPTSPAADVEASDGPDGGRIASVAPPSGAAGTPGEVDEALLAELVGALQRGDGDALQHLAGRYVDVYAGLSDQFGSERAHYYRVLRAADLANLLTTVMRAVREQSPEVMADPFLARVELSEQARQVDQFRRMIADHIRSHLDALEHTAGQAPRNRRLEELDLFTASTTDLRELRHVVRPLARKLASRLSQRRRHHRRGRLDMRRTLRRSLTSGGVPVDVTFHDRRQSKPDIVMLCDVSGSVAEFAHFTLLLMHALHAELARLRTFVFVDGIADVTHTLCEAVDDYDPRFLVHQPGVVVGDGHSDYGNMLATFTRDHEGLITPATTLIITGDARTNYRAAGLNDFALLATRAKRVYWLNPEPRQEWDDKDSQMTHFAALCTDVFEVRTLRDLAQAVERVTA